MKHRDEVLRLLQKQIGNKEEVDDISKTAAEVATHWVSPVSGGKEETNGLIYGLVQSGKTGVLAATGALGADEGYRTIIVLTSDNDPLYEQTLGRVREAFPGMEVIGKEGFRDADAFVQKLKSGTCAIVTTKNSGRLATIIQNLQQGRVRGLSCLIIDDEADQASLNTRAWKDDGANSPINDSLIELRGFFEKNTYLQVTATPQALFLQSPGHRFRPKFTVLSHPGAGYVGGDDFFDNNSLLVKEFPLADIAVLAPGLQPHPALALPQSLRDALDIFMVGATFKRSRDADQNCAFLCHVSTRKADHNHIVDLLQQYKTQLAAGVVAKNPQVLRRLKAAFDDLAGTHVELARSDFDTLVDRIGFYSRGAVVKLVNGETDEDVAVQAPYNLFVGGNKLGRGVTIKNLLVSYYGRNPKRPQSDTVLQHARMYGYRRKDIGLLRLFLPPELRVAFSGIHKMERGLRDLIARHPTEEFRGLFVESGLTPTRKNVLAPGSVGVYSGGSTYNPSQVLRDSSVDESTAAIDVLVSAIKNKSYDEVALEVVEELIALCRPDHGFSDGVWNSTAIAKSLLQYGKVTGSNRAYVYVDRERGLREPRPDNRGILTGGEADIVPTDRPTLFLLRIRSEAGSHEVWWPQVRFPDGSYAFAFAI